MRTVSATGLARRTSRVIDDVLRTNRPTIITRRGRPVAAMVAIDSDELEDYVLSRAPEFVRSMATADADLRAGQTRAVEDVFAE